jgi:hypothetical protein
LLYSAGDAADQPATISPSSTANTKAASGLLVILGRGEPLHRGLDDGLRDVQQDDGHGDKQRHQGDLVLGGMGWVGGWVEGFRGAGDRKCMGWADGECVLHSRAAAHLEARRHNLAAPDVVAGVRLLCHAVKHLVVVLRVVGGGG